jgi:delta24-sterol reductase
MKKMVYPKPSFELHQRQGDMSHAQMFTDVGVYYTPAFIFGGKEFNLGGSLSKTQ